MARLITTRRYDLHRDIHSALEDAFKDADTVGLDSVAWAIANQLDELHQRINRMKEGTSKPTKPTKASQQATTQLLVSYHDDHEGPDFVQIPREDLRAQIAMLVEMGIDLGTVTVWKQADVYIGVKRTMMIHGSDVPEDPDDV